MRDAPAWCLRRAARVAREMFPARAADIVRNIDLLDVGLPFERGVR